MSVITSHKTLFCVTVNVFNIKNRSFNKNQARPLNTERWRNAHIFSVKVWGIGPASWLGGQSS